MTIEIEDDEAPEHIPGYFDPADRRTLKDGMVITIEPFLSMKSRVVTETADGWTLVGVRQAVGPVRAHDDRDQGPADRHHLTLNDPS